LPWPTEAVTISVIYRPFAIGVINRKVNTIAIVFADVFCKI